MKKAIDCLLIGYNEVDFREHKKLIERMGVTSGGYRDLNLNFIQYDNQPYTASGIYNLFSDNGQEPNGSYKPLSAGLIFSAAIAYLGTYLHRRGFSFDYINAFQDEKEELAEKLVNNDILTIAITTTMYVSAVPILEIIDFIKRSNNTAKIIVGGPFIATQMRTQEPASLKYLLEISIGADIYVNSSQGEAALVEIICSIKKNLPLHRVNNLYYRTGAGDYVSTPRVEENNRLSENMVRWDLFEHRLGELVNVRTAISCPFSCAFCGFPEHGGKHQAVSAENIEQELNQLDKVKSVKIVNFIDDTFNVPIERFKKILKMISKNKYSFKWVSNFRCQYADREIIQLMKESGCVAVFLGIEAGNNQILKNMKKSATVEKYMEGIRLLKEFGIITFGSFIVGFPGETYETARDTLEFINKSEIDFYRINLWYCEPITPIWREREKYGIKGVGFEWSHKTMDFKTACSLKEDMIVLIEKSLWVPLYHFDFDNIWHLTNRGMSLDQVKNFLRAFNSGIKEKLIHPDNREVSFHVIRDLQRACRGNDGPGTLLENEKRTYNKLEASFDF